MPPIHPRLKLTLELAGLLADLAEAGSAQLAQRLRPRRRGSYLTRRPGPETPLWNACAERLRGQLKPYGSKVRLARYLGIPKQRLHEYLESCRRLPDAETTLHLLTWLAHKEAGTDLSL